MPSLRHWSRSVASGSPAFCELRLIEVVTHHIRDRTLVLDVLERVWLATLYGRDPTTKAKRRR